MGFVVERIHENDGTIPNVLRVVAIHEAGHLIGLDHVPVPGESVMFPSIDHGATCPTRFDMKQLCLRYGCDWRDMKYCG